MTQNGFKWVFLHSEGSPPAIAKESLNLALYSVDVIQRLSVQHLLAQGRPLRATFD